MRVIIAVAIWLLSLQLSAQDSLKVGFIPQGRDLVSPNNEKWTGLAVYTLGIVAGAHFLTAYDDGRKDAGYLFMGIGSGGGMALMLGSLLRDRRRH